MPRARTDFARALAAIAVLGVVLRAIYLFAIARHVTGIGDWHFYHWQANLIADGHGFIEPYKYTFDGHVSASAGHPPLYPLALSVVSLLGGQSELSHRALGLILGACTIVLVGLLGRRLGGPRTGLLAALLCAIYPLMIAVDGALMSETLYGPLIALMLLCAFWLRDRPGLVPAAAFGAVTALAALTRTEALLFVPVLGIPLALRSGSGRWLRVLVVVAACIVVVAPWTIRNAVRFHAFVPISTNDSTVIAGANCPLTYHGVDLGGWNINCISPRRRDNEAKQAAIWRHEGLRYARDHAGRLPVVAAVRLLRIWDLWQPRRQLMFAEGRDRNTEKAGVGAYYLLMLVGAFGLWALWRRGAPLLILLAPALVVCISAVTGYGVPRLRHSFEIPLLVLAAVGLQDLWARRPAARA